MWSWETVSMGGEGENVGGDGVSVGGGEGVWVEK